MGDVRLSPLRFQGSLSQQGRNFRIYMESSKHAPPARNGHRYTHIVMDQPIPKLEIRRCREGRRDRATKFRQRAPLAPWPLDTKKVSSRVGTETHYVSVRERSQSARERSRNRKRPNAGNCAPSVLHKLAVVGNASFKNN